MWVLTFCFVPFKNASTFYWWLIINNYHFVLFPLFSNLLHFWLSVGFFPVFSIWNVLFLAGMFLLLYIHRKGKKEKVLGDGSFMILLYIFLIAFFKILKNEVTKYIGLNKYCIKSKQYKETQPQKEATSLLNEISEEWPDYTREVLFRGKE